VQKVSGKPSGHTARAAWVLLPVEGFPIKRRWSLVWRSDAPLAAPARQFVAYLQKAQHENKVLLPSN
jgi:hypothetical protein